MLRPISSTIDRLVLARRRGSGRRRVLGVVVIRHRLSPTISAACSGRVAIAQVLNQRPLRLANGKIVELIAPQPFLPTPSPDQPDYFALNEEFVNYLKRHLEGRTVAADLTQATLALCGEDRVTLGTGLVTQGLLYVEQAAGPLEATSQESWVKLETQARQQQRGLWKRGVVGAQPFERVARLTHVGLAGEQRLDEIRFDGIVSGTGKKLTPANIEALRAVVANSAIVLMPRSVNFWQLCCDIEGSWLRVYYPRRAGIIQTADYLESAELETFFRRIFDSPGTSPLR